MLDGTIRNQFSPDQEHTRGSDRFNPKHASALASYHKIFLEDLLQGVMRMRGFLNTEHASYPQRVHLLVPKGDSDLIRKMRKNKDQVVGAPSSNLPLPHPTEAKSLDVSNKFSECVGEKVQRMRTEGAHEASERAAQEGDRPVAYHEVLCLARAEEEADEKTALFMSLIQMQDQCSFQFGREVCELFRADSSFLEEDERLLLGQLNSPI